MGKIIASFVLLAALFSFFVTPAKANYNPFITPVADAYTSSAHATSTHGTSSRLWVENDANEVMHTYLKFDLSEIGSDLCTYGTAEDAILELKVDDVSTGDHVLYQAASSSWTEGTLKWNNEPGSTGSAFWTTAASEEATVGNSVFMYIPQSVITSLGCNGILSLEIVGGGTNAVAFTSRESANPPVLFVGVDFP